MSQPSMEIGSIAIVEDEPVLRRLMRLWLEADGYTVVEYSSGREATMADTSGTAIVCLDLQLGDAPGESVLAELRARDPDLPVIVVTGDQDLETAAQAMRAGAYDCVTKPFDRERLGQAVRRAMERRQLTSDLHRLQQQLGERSAQGPASDVNRTRARDDEDQDLALLSSAPPPPNMPEGLDDRSKANDIAAGGGSTLNLREIERVAIAQALKLAGGSVGKAAKLLGIGRATLYRRLSEQRGISNDDGQARPPERRDQSLGSDAAPPPRQSEMRAHNPEAVSKLNGHVART